MGSVQLFSSTALVSNGMKSAREVGTARRGDDVLDKFSLNQLKWREGQDAMDDV